MDKLKCASFFAGVGGIDLGFEYTGKFETVYANEFDASPVKTYELNFPGVKVDTRNIREVEAGDIPDFEVMLAGFPCQAFSIAGYRKGFNDERGRGNLFFELSRILGERTPRVAFFENVKCLKGHDGGRTFQTICNELDKLEYHYKDTYRVLNAKDFGNVAQNRERIYIIAFRDRSDYERFKWPEPLILTSTVKDIIDFDDEVDEKYYYTEGKYAEHIYTKLVEALKDDDPDNPSICQWRRSYVRKNQSGVIPTLTANQGMGGHNVCIIRTNDGRIRKMTPRECFNAQGFPNGFKLPDDTPDYRLYKQAGNSVCVTVIQRIAENIAEALKR